MPYALQNDHGEFYAYVNEYGDMRFWHDAKLARTYTTKRGANIGAGLLLHHHGRLLITVELVLVVKK